MIAKFARRLIENTVRTNFSFVLANALENFQVIGFNSILLHRSDDLVLRLYVCEPGKSNLDKSLDQDDNTLLIHNHRFYFQCQTLFGWMANLTYSESQERTEAGRWFKYGYKSAITSNDGMMRLSLEDSVNLSLDSVEYIEEGDSYELQPEQLHKILVPSDRLVVMLFWEHAKVQIDQKLYSRCVMPLCSPTRDTNLQFAEPELRRVLSVVTAALKERE